MNPEDVNISESGTIHKRGQCYGHRYPYVAGKQYRRACCKCFPNGVIIREKD